MDEIPCPVCEGSVWKEAQFFKIDEQNITELCAMDISDLTAWFHDLDSRLSDKQQRIATEVIKK
jgi:excinuclease ABC subunit A